MLKKLGQLDEGEFLTITINVKNMTLRKGSEYTYL